MARRFHNNRGVALLMSYLVLSLVLVYSNTMVLRTVSQRMAVERARDRIQAQYLAQSAAEQLRVELEDFLTKVVYKYTLGSASPALSWLDNILTTSTPVTSGSVANNAFTLLFDLPVKVDSNTGRPCLVQTANGSCVAQSTALQLGVNTAGQRAGEAANPLCLDGLPTIPNAAVCTSTATPVTEPRAWITSVCAAKGQGPPADPHTDPDPNNDGHCAPQSNPLADRIVTIQAEARVGTVMKRIQVRYRFELPNASVFAYAYFVNNHGWFDISGNQSLRIEGEVRSNGDLTFRSDQVDGNGEFPKLAVEGDLFASQNPAILTVDPHTGQPQLDPNTGQPLTETGLITGNPSQMLDWTTYWSNPLGGSIEKRSTLRLVAPSQPLITNPVDPRTNLSHTGMVAYGSGWDTAYYPSGEHQDPTQVPKTDQTRNGRLPIHDMPYLGNLSLYETIAKQYNNGTGSTLTYYPPALDANGQLQVDGTGNLILQNTPVTLDHGIYDPAKGPDQQAGTLDDQMPLILVANGTHRITIDGPIIVPGDVMIKSFNSISGFGTIYAGRNVHVVGQIWQGTNAREYRLQRDSNTGRIRVLGFTSGADDRSNLGQVCRDGSYHLPNFTTTPPSNAVPDDVCR